MVHIAFRDGKDSVTCLYSVNGLNIFLYPKQGGISMKKKNKIVPLSSNNSEFSLDIPNGNGRFERGIDGRGNPFEKTNV